MPDYKELYYTLFGKVADAVEQLDSALPDEGTPDLLGIYRARAILIVAMQDAEEAFLKDGEETK